jgi:NADH dehydrogenase [ubiquinone] 1 alpha subcomplex assembly factor 5
VLWTVPVERIVADEEKPPFEPESQDAILSCLALHWINDLPGNPSQLVYVLYYFTS